MIALQNSLLATSSEINLRPIDARRDLNQIADLIELCFSDTIDPDGQSYIRHIRRAARNPAYLQWASTLGERAPLPITGFVWENEGQLIGNLTLIPVIRWMQSSYLIANVAVHPEFRRRGIARQLTMAALDYTKQHNAQAVWLHVREENFGAYQLYQSLGFVEQGRRSTWQYSVRYDIQSDVLANGLRVVVQPAIGKRKYGDWILQEKWLEKSYPLNMRWHLPIKPKLLRPGFITTLYRFLIDARVDHWCARYQDRLLGVLSWQSTMNQADHLWLATHPDNEEIAAYNLLSFITRKYRGKRPLSLDYPAGRIPEAIRAAGFRLHQTLVWMNIT